MFYSGFCLNGEEGLFDEFLPSFGEYIAGFSYGSIAALKFAAQNKDVAKLILLSPAYYTHKSADFKEAQIAAFETDPALYRLKLLKKSGLSEEEGKRYGIPGTSAELRELLYFDWNASEIASVSHRGVKIEVFIGGNDRVVEPEASAEFFRQYGSVYYLKNKNHILR